MITSILARYFNIRTLALLLIYLLVLTVSYWIAYELRFDFNVPETYQFVRINTLWWVIMLKLMLLMAFGQVDCILAYFRLPDAFRLFVGLFLATLVLVSIWYVYLGNEVPPRSVILSDFQMSFLGLVAVRVLFRIKSSRSLEDWLAEKTQRKY